MDVTVDRDGEKADEQAVEDFAGWVFDRFLGGMETLSIHIGSSLGLYAALRHAPATAAELAARTGMDRRYAREWLEQQATAGILDSDGEGEGDELRFRLPPAQAAVLTDRSCLGYSAPLPDMFAAVALRMADLMDAYRSGRGVPWAAFGAAVRDGQGDINRPWFENVLAKALASVPRVHEVLSRPDAGIADVACGHGWSTIGLARAYPDAIVDGFDIDAPAIEAAHEHAAGLENVTFSELRGEQLADEGEDRYDAAFVFEALHDMPDPVAVLSAISRAVRSDGVVVVMDEAVAEAFSPQGDDTERAMYGYSLLICLPDSMSTPGSVATGTVMRHATLERYAREAGFSAVSILPIDGFAAFRFYLLER
ncbi:MAG: SAM-dependent methyltransferase [Microbacterium sp.]|jgi:SAM-dependent methyltransferase|uniref:class I SAM-dependent methyltransferase n=1 Tax=Microbacterium sp. TaxID=51671 RepID=UPI00262D4172|nr:class I SAM-dependent methyltransferase [Microbacterium sp.]MDF2562702.1 SAM-dependent methyltransferase [Microbacterium sp.]